MRRFFLWSALLLFVFVVGVVIFGSIVWGRLYEPHKGYTAAEQFVEIAPGTGTGTIGRHLVEAGVVRDLFIFRAALLWNGRTTSLKAGEYRFDQPLSAVDVIERLVRGDVYSRRVTFPEGLTIVEMAAIWESRGFGKAAEFVQASKNAALIADLDPQAKDLEGYLFPNTYDLPRGTPAAKMVERMVNGFKAAYDEELRGFAADQGLTTRQVVTLAALVEKETGQDTERPMVAAVYRNRLKIGMPMQADPTLIYALQEARKYDGNIRRTDFDFDSPYNTYKYPGLPPGPIASPGKGSLAASLKPADVPYLYFVSRNDGSHVFASTLPEHNRNVQKFQVEYFRAQRQRQGAGGGRR